MTAIIPTQEESPQMFDRIARRYDLLNRTLSFGQDILWRKRVRRHLPKGDNLRVLDLATGTGDLMFELISDPRVASVRGVDPSVGMLEVAEKKLAEHKKRADLSVAVGDACDLAEYHGDDFDAATIAFGIRNVPDPPKALRELYATLKPGGVLIVLEFSEPQGALFGPVYRVYRRHFLPKIGTVVSGDKTAYTYLDKTIAEFPFGEAFLSWMRDAGFENPYVDAFSFGAVSIYVGKKPEQTD